MASPAPRTAEQRTPGKLDELPVELLTPIFGLLNIKDAFHLARTSKFFHKIYKLNSIYILRPILLREFSPLEGLLRLVDSPKACDDIEAPFSIWVNCGIEFGGLRVSDDPQFSHLPPLEFNQGHLHQILEIAKAVSKWESTFPRLRFSELVEERRRLRAHEKHRLRCALYNFWRYSNSYHQNPDDYDVSLSWAGSPAQREIRADSLRLLPTTQLYEMLDLWKTVSTAVATQLCPSASLLRTSLDYMMSPVYFDRRSWGDGRENSNIVRGVLRIRPDKLLELLDFAADHPTASKEMVLSMIQARHPAVGCANEDLGSILDWIIRERLHQFPAELNEFIVKLIEKRYFPMPYGGILDEVDLEESSSQPSSDAGDWEPEENWEDEDNEGISYDEDANEER